MELKSGGIIPIINLLACFNRTFMELKLNSLFKNRSALSF